MLTTIKKTLTMLCTTGVLFCTTTMEDTQATPPSIDELLSISSTAGDKNAEYEVKEFFMYSCPHCQKFNMEMLCREIFEQLFKEKFPKIKPDWLLSDKGRRLELDGYSEKLQIAFEYNGPFHTREDAQRRDQIKKKLCQKAGVSLFVVDYKLDLKNLPDFINCYSLIF